MVHNGRQLRRRFGQRGLAIALALVTLAAVAGVIVLIN
jgi:hypothetical protein